MIIIHVTKKTVDGLSGKLWYNGHGIAQNIIPASTGAAEVVGKVIPELKGKLTYMVFRVFNPNMPIVYLACHLEKASKYDDIKKVKQQVSEGLIMGIQTALRTRLSPATLNSDTPSSSLTLDWHCSQRLLCKAHFLV
ncbi:hypothetical protein U0070_018704 [Myodes glareolus]|uniref:glyceraldehyde-3-phosphate dehydrogenase (phosphorylating) n=1 Tax=Myodes glareolus TaxID=447135 RepID=A0AAW0IVG7_MYOGA